MLMRFENDKDKIPLLPPTIPVIGVHVSKSKLKLKVGQQELLTASVLPHHASNQAVQWASNRPDIVEIVPNGRSICIIGRNPGRAIIVVTTEEGKLRDICVVHVCTYVTKPN